MCCYADCFVIAWLNYVRFACIYSYLANYSISWNMSMVLQLKKNILHIKCRLHLNSTLLNVYNLYFFVFCHLYLAFSRNVLQYIANIYILLLYCAYILQSYARLNSSLSGLLEILPKCILLPYTIHILMMQFLTKNCIHSI